MYGHTWYIHKYYEQRGCTALHDVLAAKMFVLLNLDHCANENRLAALIRQGWLMEDPQRQTLPEQHIRRVL